MKKHYIFFFDTDQILFPYFVHLLITISRVINADKYDDAANMKNVVLVIIAISSGVIISVFSVMLLWKELFILRDWSNAVIYGEATDKIKQISQVYNLRNTPAALLARLNRIAINLVGAPITIFLSILILIITYITTGNTKYLFSDYKLVSDLFLFLTMSLLNLQWVLYLIIVRPYSSVQQNNSVIINSVMQLIFLILFALHS